MRAIISYGLYTFDPIFYCGLKIKKVNITDDLYTKQGNYSIKSTVNNQERFEIKVCSLSSNCDNNKTIQLSFVSWFLVAD